MNDGLVYIGKIINLSDIPRADLIVLATVVCGVGGRWRGIVQKGVFKEEDTCVVFLPDAQLNPEIHRNMQFMKDTAWRVKMRRFKGVPSEVVIMGHHGTIRYHKDEKELPVGSDVTVRMCVTKYEKPVPAHLNGYAIGVFPSFIPKTDEPNYQRCPELVDQLVGKPYYVTEKADGSSTTAYKWKGVFGVCSRNLEIKRDEENGYWMIAIRYKLEENLPDGIAVQWETVGPGIQSNPMGWKKIEGLLFSAYNIHERRYLTFIELCRLSLKLHFPMVQIYEERQAFSKDELELRGNGLYDNHMPREGVVVRSKENLLNGKPISFKVINLGYEK